MNSKEFKKLQSVWNKKLKDSGFNDIEKWSVNGNQSSYKMLDNFDRNKNRSEKLGKGDRYRIIGIYAYNYKKLDTDMAKVLQLYANSMTLKEAIAETKSTLKPYQVTDFIRKNMQQMINFVNNLEIEESI